MNVLLTGATGTLGPKFRLEAERHGASVTGWDRGRVSPDDDGAVEKFLDETRPDAIVHLAMGSEAWAARLAGYAGARAVPFVFTSSVMVFHLEPDGPHAPQDEPTTQDAYGQYKVRCERAILQANPDASVARIGWQIDPDARGNNMLAHLDAQQAQSGCIRASRAWIPACSFMADTAAGLWQLVESPRGGVLHLDSNAVEAKTFDEVVAALRATFRRDGWHVVVTDEYRHDQRLVGGPLEVPGLSARLRSLA